MLLAAHLDALTRAALRGEQPQAADRQVWPIAFFEDAQEFAANLARRTDNTDRVAH